MEDYGWREHGLSQVVVSRNYISYQSQCSLNKLSEFLRTKPLHVLCID